SGSGGDAVYGRVARTDTRIVLQYWLYYYDNPLLLPATPFGVFWQSHESDWELVNVVLDRDRQPVEAAYSQHCTGERMPWTRVEKSPHESTHPVVYVALGSHANYFAPGDGPLGTIPIPTSCIPPSIAPAALQPAVDGADPALAAVPAGRRPGAGTVGGRRRGRAARHWRRAGDDPSDRGHRLVGLRRLLGRVGVLLHADPARARSGRRLPARRRPGQPREPG